MNKTIVYILFCIASVFQFIWNTHGATSSLKSASDYRYTKPKVVNHIIGKVMGTNMPYRIVRSEDISFLSEAQAEIWVVTNPFTFPIGSMIPVDSNDSVILKSFSDTSTWGNTEVNSALHTEYAYGMVSQDIEFLGDGIELTNKVMNVSEIVSGDTTEYVITNDFVIKKNRIPKSADITKVFSNINSIQELKICDYQATHEYDYGSGNAEENKTTSEYDRVRGFTNGTFITTHYPAESSKDSSSGFKYLYSDYITGNISKVRGLSFDNDSMQTDTITTKKVSHDTNILKSIGETHWETSLKTDDIYSADFDHIDTIECFAILGITTTTNIIYSIWKDKSIVTSNASGTETIYIGAKIKANISTNNTQGIIYIIPDYDDTENLVNSIRNNLIPSKYGDNEIGDEINYPSVSDAGYAESKISTTYSNDKIWTIDYKIYFSGIVTLAKLKYRTTFE